MLIVCVLVYVYVTVVGFVCGFFTSQPSALWPPSRLCLLRFQKNCCPRPVPPPFPTRTESQGHFTSQQWKLLRGFLLAYFSDFWLCCFILRPQSPLTSLGKSGTKFIRQRIYVKPQRFIKP